MQPIDKHGYTHRRGALTLLHYHLIWCPRRRRPVLIGLVADRLRAVLQQTAATVDTTILDLAVQPDHLHLFVSAPPTLSPAQLAFRFKGASARLLRHEFPHLRRMPSMWTTSYFCSTAGRVASETIAAYIQAQSTRA